MYVPPSLKLPEDQLRRMKELYAREMELRDEIWRVALERLGIVIDLLKKLVSFDEIAYIRGDSEFVAFKVNGEWFDDIDVRERLLLDREAAEALSWLLYELRSILTDSLDLDVGDSVEVKGVRVLVVEDFYSLIEEENVEPDSY